MALPDQLLDIRRIFLEAKVAEYPRGQEILARYPDAERIPVTSHWMIPSLHGNAGSAEDWLRIKRDTLVLGVKKALTFRPNGRSAHFIAPSTSNGCAMACAYCYVPRRKGFANPISLFVNIEEIRRALSRHAARQGPLGEPDQIDERAWVYDLGENGDLSVDALLCDNVRDLVATFRDIPNGKGSFATKFVNRDLLGYDPQGRMRIRFSLMPEAIARVVDVRTSPIADRIAAIDDFVRAGYEVHVNFSPVIVYRGWEDDWRALFGQIDAALSPAAKAQLKAEVIFLTHNEQLHEVNQRWHPRAEDLLWTPETQETKLSQGGMVNLRYRVAWKRQWLDRFQALLARSMPYCGIRYAF
ncbi:spore photoproduct lyase family protein [Lichenihabitans sp. Uapishka_5]|uniref:spore photoproduct lyase family protein n=1 Tax=Lichenihabitans sp. Uapishka_5 TaxID=3037302 RepID=UPI0029E7ECA2|nr:spore photoproduct lyase family protein [Lichenihabitans sp. Uapishka_5]MDX7951170.1 spore photoproduct lyase family protein [Lichenihabitans sp. Uapishka_5]